MRPPERDCCCSSKMIPMWMDPLFFLAQPELQQALVEFCSSRALRSVLEWGSVRWRLMAYDIQNYHVGHVERGPGLRKIGHLSFAAAITHSFRFLCPFHIIPVHAIAHSASAWRSTSDTTFIMMLQGSQPQLFILSSSRPPIRPPVCARVWQQWCYIPLPWRVEKGPYVYKMQTTQDRTNLSSLLPVEILGSVCEITTRRWNGSLMKR